MENRGTRKGVLVLALLLGGLSLGGPGAEAARQVDTGNRAHVDAGATSQVQARAVQITEALLSYSGTDAPSKRAGFDDLVTGDLAARYAEVFGKAEEVAAQQRLTLTTTPTHSGVRRLEGTKAEVLLFVTQSSTRPGTQPNVSGAQFVLTLLSGDGGWRTAKASAIDLLGAA